MHFRCLLPLFALLMTAPIYGQVARASVSGAVYDSSGAIVPAAKVTIVNTERNARESRVANETGRYLFSDLVPGHYDLEASAPGFKLSRTTGVTLEVGQQLEINPALEVGQTTESVAVTAAAVELETANGTVSGVVGRKQVSELPLNGRDFYSLLQLIPNVRAGVPGVSSAEVPSINGGRTWGVEAVLDGAPATAAGVNPAPGARSPAYNVGLDNVQEFRVLSNAPAAEYGNSYGGYVSVVSRSGSNQYHGGLFEYLRNSYFDANNFFNNRAGLPLGSFKRHQFGGTFGGPVRRDKTFFFFYYDGLRSSSGANAIRTVPSLLERTGDFSQTFNAQGQLVNIYDPLTTKGAGNTATRALFPGNIIPQARLDAVAQNVTALLPQPNDPGLRFTHANNLVAAYPNVANSNKMDARIDHRFSEAHSVFGRISYGKDASNVGAPLGALDNSVSRVQPAWNAVFDYTFVKSSTTVLNFHYAFSRVTAENVPDGAAASDYTKLGFSPAFATAIGSSFQFLPQITVAGLSAIGPNNATVTTPVNQQVAGSLAKVLSRHTLKMGTDVRLNHVSSNPAGAPQFVFDTTYTRGPNPTLATAIAGAGTASFLLGAGSGSYSASPVLHISAPNFAIYLQDDWKVTRRLTLNLGIRYDLFFPRTEANNELNYFDPLIVSPLAAQTGLNLHGGLRFVGQNGADSRQVPIDGNNFSPRFGFAYSLNAKTVLRGGYGILYPMQSYGPNISNAGFQGFDALTQWVASTDNLTPTGYLRNAFGTGFLASNNGSLGLLTNIGQNVATPFRTQAAASTYTQQWNLSLQRSLNRYSLVEVSYLGNRGLHLPVQPGMQLDSLTPDKLALGAALTDPVPNPFFGVITNGALSGATVTRGQLLRPFPQFSTVNALFAPMASSTYHALGVRLQARAKERYFFSLAYTDGKEIDDASEHWGPNDPVQNFYSLRQERALSSQDISQTLVASAIMPIPLHGRILGGWQVNTILTLQTGIPLGLTCQQNTTGSLGGGCRPNSTGQPAGLTGTIADRLNQYFDTKQFTQPAFYTFGNVGRSLPDVRAPGLHNLDVSLSKVFPIRERLRLQFRAETFNITNTPLFGAPNAVFGGPSFGVISTQANAPRQIQMALRLDF